MHKRRPRIIGFDYTGFYRYFLTFCTAERHRAFTNEAIVAAAFEQIQLAAAARRFGIIAYVFMPDHLHLLVEGLEENADLRSFAHLGKQKAGYRYSRAQERRLWQPGYVDRVLRDQDDTWDVVRYILENPVRAGLVERFDEYPYSGSGTVSREELVRRLEVNSGKTWQP